MVWPASPVQGLVFLFFCFVFLQEEEKAGIWFPFSLFFDVALFMCVFLASGVWLCVHERLFWLWFCSLFDCQLWPSVIINIATQRKSQAGAHL